MTAISSIVNQYFRSYDRNGDANISTKAGQGFEGSHVERQYLSSYDRDEIIVTRYSNDKLFKAADKDNNGLVSRAELADAIKLFDTNNDGKLENSGPFWNRKGELRNFDKAYPERAQILEHHIIPKPQPPVPHFPNQPYPGYPHSPNHPYPRAYASASVGVSVA